MKIRLNESEMSIEPNKQVVYLISDDLTDVFPDAKDATDAALDMLEGTQCSVVINGDEMPIVITDDIILIGDVEASDYDSGKAKKLLEMWANDELYTASEVERENYNITPDEEYPMRVDIADGNNYTAVSYYPSEQQMSNAVVRIWSGSGYTADEFYVNVPHGADNVYDALDKAIVMAEKVAPKLLMDPQEIEEEAAKDGHYDMDTGEGDEVFEETYIYEDATMAGAKQPYYIYAENFGVSPYDGPLA